MTSTRNQVPGWFKTLDGPELLQQILKSYDRGTLAQELTAYREQIENWESGRTMRNQRMRPLFAPHTVKRILQRRVPIDAVAQIAEFGVVVQENGNRVMKRGEVNNLPIHVVVERPNAVVSVYFADEWQSTITVQRVGKGRRADALVRAM